MKSRPAHGFPGGPPTPPYGGNLPRNAPPEEPSLSPTPVDESDVPAPETLDDIAVNVETTRRVSSRVALFVVATLTIGSIAGYLLHRSGRDTESTTPPVSTVVQDVTQAAPPPPADTAPPPVGAGNGVFASVDVAACNTMTSSIGASNEYVSGRPATSDTPQLRGSGIYAQPQWIVELPESVQRGKLLADAFPPSSSIIRGISDQSLVLFNPLDPAAGSKVGVYRIQSGELIWSAAVPAGVSALVDSRRMYFIDERDPSLTTIAVMIPSLGQTIACYSAIGTPTPRPSPFDRTAIAHEGTLYLALANETSTHIQALSDAGLRSVATAAPARLGLLGVSGAPGAQSLVAAFGAGQQLKITGIALDAGAPEYLTSQAEMNSAPRPNGWGESGARSAVLAENGDGWTSLEVRDALVGPEGVLLAIGTSGTGVRLVHLDVTGQPVWAAYARSDAPQGWAVSSGTYHLTTQPGIGGEPGRTVIVETSSGREIGGAEQLRTTALGSEFLAYTSWDPDFPVQVYHGATKVGSVAGTATSLSPVASGSSALMLYCEDAGKKYLAVFILDPSGEEGPQS